MAYTSALILKELTSRAEGVTAGDLEDVYFNGPVSIEQFGVRVSVTLGAGTTAFGKIALDVSSTEAETDRTEKVTITYPASIAAGELIISTSPKQPVRVPVGGHITIEQLTAANPDTGDVVPFILFRMDGFADVNSPKTNDVAS